MSRPIFSIFAQQYLCALLSNFGEVYLNTLIPRDPKLRIYKSLSRSDWGKVFLSALMPENERVMISPEVIGEAEIVDILFEPDLNLSRTSLGLLGELLFVPCIIEPFRWSPNEWEIRTCLGHWLTWKTEAYGTIIPVDESSAYQAQDEDEDEDENDYYEEAIDKILIIIVPSIPPNLLMGFGAKPSAINISGVYELAPAFCTTIVVVNELPKNEDTLWLRLLGRGPTQRSAIQELMKLELDYPEKEFALEQLQQWHQLLLAGEMGKESKYLMQLLGCIESK